MAITRVFYQSWDIDLPEVVHAQNRRCLPDDFTYARFGLTEIRAYLAGSWGREVLRVFDGYRHIAHKVDLWRYCLLHERGGVYMDADCVLLNPIQALVDSYQCFFVANTRGVQNIFNGFLGTAPGNPILAEVIEYMLRIGNDFDDYYFNCNALYAIVRRHVPIEIGQYDYPVDADHVGERVAILWDTAGDDGRYYAYHRGTPILVETNEHYPYPKRWRRP